jgi:hypothetical protein
LISNHDDDSPPGAVLRSPAYQDLCGFFATFPESRDRQPRFGDWVIVPPSQQPCLVLEIDAGLDRLIVLAAAGRETESHPRAACVWLPTLDQARLLIREHFGTTGFFSSTFNDSTYWYTGQMLGMTVTNMQPLAEGSSPHEAAIKALLMRHQW